MTEKKFKLIGDGVTLEFYKAFDVENKGLKMKLWKWFDNYFKYSRCDFNKEISHFRVFYRDTKTENLKKKLLQYRSSAEGQGIDLTIKLSGDLISEPLKSYVGSEFVTEFSGITEFVYNEFFETNPIKSIVETAKDSARIEEIINQGRISTKTLIDSVVAEFIDPVPAQYLLGGAVK